MIYRVSNVKNLTGGPQWRILWHMIFRSAMCPNCDSLIKIDSESGTIFCANCGIQLQAEDAFVYYELKTNGSEELINGLESYNLLAKLGTDYLSQKKYGLAEACFANILKNHPDDYQIWKLRALNWESQAVNEFHKPFYEYDKKRGLVENKEYVAKFREYSEKAVQYCPGGMEGELAEELNDHVRGHFNIAHRAYAREKRKVAPRAALTGAALFALAALILYALRM